MNRPRWYATPITLPDGRIYIQGGTAGNPVGGPPRESCLRPRDGTFRLLTGVNTSGLFPLYPRNWVAPNGRVFGYADRTMYYVDPNANSITVFGTMPSDGPSGWKSTEVMYAPGKILRCGGGSNCSPREHGARKSKARMRRRSSTSTWRRRPTIRCPRCRNI